MSFRRDALLAHQLTDDIHVFSLEGCVAQGFLERLRTVDWSERVTVPDAEIARVERARTVRQSVLWLGSGRSSPS